MADIFSVKKRSLIMAGVKTKNTAPERKVKSVLKRLRIKYRSNVASLPGKPDLVLIDKRVALFVNGCFWHLHKNCSKAKLPSTNKAFWRNKIISNVHRDKNVSVALKRLGWKVITIWECKTKSHKIEALLMKKLKHKI
jgi:DNA mismatch endonuclease, patch repair protein